MLLRNRRARFLTLFLLILFASFAFIAWNPINDRVIVPFTSGLAAVASWILNLLGQQTSAFGTGISSPTFAVDVKNGCNGIEAMLILLAAILAFPMSWRARVQGIALGTVLIQILNMIRITTLYLLGKYHPQLFDIFHNAVWQVVIVFSAVVFFFGWVRRVGSASKLEAAR